MAHESHRLIRLESESERHKSNREYKAFTCFLVVVSILMVGSVIGVIYTPKKGKELTGLQLLNSLYDARVPLLSGCESTVLLIRHCEKHEDGVVHRRGDNYCSWLGRERSYFLPSLFDPGNEHRRWPIPLKVFALTQKRDGQYDQDASPNYREIETVMPLAHKFSLPIEVYPFDTATLAADVFELLQSNDVCGRAIVVSWKHELIHELAEALGCGPEAGCPTYYPDDTFDEVWQLKYVFNPREKARMVPDPMKLPVSLLGPLSLYEPKIADLPVNALDDDDDDDDDQTAPVPDPTLAPTPVPTPAPEENNPQLRRILRHHKKTHTTTKEKERGKWFVYGSKTYQYFDPLQFSLKSGDYPPGGSPTGGRWADEM